MKKYISTKVVLAAPEEVNGADYYRVTYGDGYEGCYSKAGFESEYREASGLTFGEALEALKIGEKVARKGWAEGCKGMYLLLTGQFEPPAFPFIMAKQASGKVAVWLPAQADLLADDWEIVA